MTATTTFVGVALETRRDECGASWLTNPERERWHRDWQPVGPEPRRAA
jgi:hypothetical protein